MKKHRTSWFVGAALAAIVAFVGTSGCEDDDDAVVTGATCSTVCSRYQMCFNSSFDVSQCTGRCLAALNDRTIISTDVDDCAECVGENTCSPTYTCADACDLVIVIP